MTKYSDPIYVHAKLYLQLPMQSVLITINVVSSNSAQARCTDTTLCDKDCQWFSLGTPVSSTNKTI